MTTDTDGTGDREEGSPSKGAGTTRPASSSSSSSSASSSSWSSSSVPTLLRRAFLGVVVVALSAGLLPALFDEPSRVGPGGLNAGAVKTKSAPRRRNTNSNVNDYDYSVAVGLIRPGDDDEGGLGGAARAGGGRISYRLVRNRSDLVENELYKCNVRPLPSELLSTVGLIDFYPYVTAVNHTTLVLGDSVAMQIAHSLELAWGVTPKDEPDVHAVLEAGREIREVAWPTRGGGAIVTYRYPFFYDRKNRIQGTDRAKSTTTRRSRRLKMFPPWPWNQTRMEEMLTHRPIPTTSRGGVDVLVQRITHGWMDFEHITNETLTEHVEVVVDAFKPTTLILVNIMFSNNVMSTADYHEMLRKREMVRRFGRGGYVPPADGPLRRIMVLDMGLYADLLNEVNARSIGFNTSAPFEEWMLGNVVMPMHETFTTHMAHVCAETVENGTRCALNGISKDGMHVCEATVNGRTTAGLACLMACAERDDIDQAGREASTDSSSSSRTDGHPIYPNPGWRWWWKRTTTAKPPAAPFDLRQCERDCNRKFMSLDPIPASEMFEWKSGESS